MQSPMLKVADLSVVFETDYGIIRAASNVSFEIGRGEILGIVGESGSGKSVTAQTIMGLLASPPGRVESGTVEFEGTDLLSLSEKRWRDIRGKEMAMVFQEPVAVLNPVMKVGSQMVEAIRAHNRSISSSQAKARAVELLGQVQVPNPESRIDQYPHQFSGGMAQRVAIAIAMSCQPKLLIADEPTTALDVTVQAQVMKTLRTVQRSVDAAMILITHDLGLVAEIADRVIVMYAGRIVESGPIHRIFDNPRHPYTLGLMSSIPRLDVRSERLTPIKGQPPNAANLPLGCAFAPRCEIGYANERCLLELPELRAIEKDHSSACHFAEEVPLRSLRSSRRVVE